MLDIPAGRWEGLEGLEGDRLLEEQRPKAEHALRRVLAYFVGEIKKTLSGSRSGRAYRVSKRGPLHIASAPGEPPAVLFGNLRNSVGHSEPVWEGDTLSGEVGPGLGTKPAGGEQDPAETYARRLEWGGVDSRGVRILPRPYMEPTALRVEPTIQTMLEEGFSQ